MICNEMAINGHFTLLLSSCYNALMSVLLQFLPNLLNSVVFLVETSQMISVFFANYKGATNMPYKQYL